MSGVDLDIGDNHLVAWTYAIQSLEDGMYMYDLKGQPENRNKILNRVDGGWVVHEDGNPDAKCSLPNDWPQHYGIGHRLDNNAPT